MTKSSRSIDLSSHARDVPHRSRRLGEVFGDDNPVELEVGSGKGLFLANAATKHPDGDSSGSSWRRSTRNGAPNGSPSEG